MPILDVDRARTVMVIKRSMAAGFAGIDNPLYYLDRTLMLFGDARVVRGRHRARAVRRRARVTPNGFNAENAEVRRERRGKNYP